MYVTALYLRVLQWIRLRQTRKTYLLFFIMLRRQQNILAWASLHIFVDRISTESHFFPVLELSYQPALCHLGMEKREWRRANVSHSSMANPMKQSWLGGKKWDTNLRTCSNCKVSEEHRGCQELIRTLTIYRLDRKGWIAYTWAGFYAIWSNLQDGKQVSCMENICLQSHFLYKQSWSDQLGEEQSYFSLGTELWENIQIATQGWLISLWTGNICEAEISAVPQISSWHFWRRVRCQFKFVTRDLKYL